MEARVRFRECALHDSCCLLWAAALDVQLDCSECQCYSDNYPKKARREHMCFFWAACYPHFKKKKIGGKKDVTGNTL